MSLLTTDFWNNFLPVCEAVEPLINTEPPNECVKNMVTLFNKLMSENRLEFPEKVGVALFLFISVIEENNKIQTK